MIKNLTLITDKIEGFTLNSIQSIEGFFLNVQNWSSENNCFLDIDFLLKDKAKYYIARFRFSNPQGINFESGGLYHPLSIEIYDIRERGWENKEYEVIDCEGDSLRFYCSDIEVITIKETKKQVSVLRKLLI